MTVAEMLNGVMPNHEKDMSQMVKQRAEELGIKFYFGQTAKEGIASSIELILKSEDDDESISKYRRKMSHSCWS